MKYEQFTLTNDNQPDVSFKGVHLSEVSSNGEDRWTTLVLYKTKAGTYICHEIGETMFENEHTRYTVHVSQDEAELIDSLGHGWLAKMLYDGAGIEDVEHIN